MHTARNFRAVIFESQGNTYEEVVKNIRNAIKLHIEDRIAEYDLK